MEDKGLSILQTTDTWIQEASYAELVGRRWKLVQAQRLARDDRRYDTIAKIDKAMAAWRANGRKEKQKMAQSIGEQSDMREMTKVEKALAELFERKGYSPGQARDMAILGCGPSPDIRGLWEDARTDGEDGKR